MTCSCVHPRPQGYGACFSSDHRHRLAVWRRWGVDAPMAVFIALNPSIADGEVIDPTLGRMISYAQSWHMGGVEVVNLFSLIATEPADLKAAPAADRVHADADHHVLTALHAPDVGMIVAGWGAHLEDQRLAGRVVEVRRLLPFGVPVYALKKTKKGHPQHPLYLKGDAEPFVYWSPR